MKHSFFKLATLSWMLAFTSCITVYLPVVHQRKHTGRAIKKIEMEGQHLNLLVEKAGGGHLLVSVIADDVLKANPAKLSNLKVSLLAIPGSPVPYTLERIDFHHTSAHSGKTSLLKSYSPRAMADDPEFNFDDDGFYTITYVFFTGENAFYPKKFTASLEATLLTSTGKKDIQQTVDFKKIHNFSIFN